MKHLLLSSAFLIFLVSGSPAALNGATATSQLRGTIRDFPRGISGVTVELENPASRNRLLQAAVNIDGTFDVRDIPPGSYVIKVLSAHGDVIFQTLGEVSPLGATIALQWPKRKNDQKPITGTVSVAALKPVPKLALRAAKDAQKAAHQGKHEDAAWSLKEAISIYPKYAEAHAMLGVQYIRMKRHAEAVDEFQTAVELGMEDPKVYTNLGISYIELGRYDDARAALRQALTMDPLSPSANYMMGFVLGLHPFAANLAISYLEKCSDTIPKSLFTMAQIYWRSGQRQIAISTLRQFIEKTPDSQNKFARSILARISRGNAEIMSFNKE